MTTATPKYVVLDSVGLAEGGGPAYISDPLPLDEATAEAILRDVAAGCDGRFIVMSPAKMIGNSQDAQEGKNA